jgi:hypothetical protein
MGGGEIDRPVAFRLLALGFDDEGFILSRTEVEYSAKVAGAIRGMLEVEVIRCLGEMKGRQRKT